MSIQLQGKTWIAVVLVALTAVAAGAYWFGGLTPRTGTDETGEFLLVDATDRSLDGSPALALTFTIPLDSRKSYDQHIKLFEMPPPAGSGARGQNQANGDDEVRRGGPAVSVVSVKPADTAT
jgi:alpha-2-macroglobulin